MARTTARLEAITPPKDFITKMNLTGVINGALVEAGREMRRDFQKTTRTWEHQVIFTIRRELSAGSVSIRVETDDEIYGYVSGGTRPHLIAPRNKQALAFPSKFRPKTRRRVIASYKGFRGGKTVVRRTVVHHPGTEAREFEKVIAAKWQPILSKRIQDRINKAIRKRG